jgi:hypothetical protein
MWVDARFLFSFINFHCAFFIVVAHFLLLMLFDLCELMQDFFSLSSVFVVLFFIVVARFLLLMPLNVSLFSFMTGFNYNWFICVGFTYPSLFLSSATCIKLHMKTESLDF